ncbi:hypothetical protein GLW04_19290 [Halobacillus litoralis]|uniref:Ribbon-helix-helix protein CopG domain-containing protein n=1 Tax=Halobacillus litoralis TaxID=45668 RepID=A0A845E0E1_9BACI|nr:hypothetical protein [Halobacillus litoralis]MYL22022.1 hypothetical protein [Halobacillus litoralis]MYL39832.1 hypothetical protein [Halobacillus litoralis]
MEVKIRDLNPSLVKEIDEKAKRSKLSRQQYLKDLLENHVLIRELNSREMELKNTLEKNTEILRMVGQQLDKSTVVLNTLLEEEEE